MDPIIIASAPAAKAFAISPENFIPPSEIILTFFLLSAFLTSIIAEIWGTPIPATILVVQIEPGPIPTFMISAPELYNFFAASPVAIFPTQIGILLAVFFNFDKVFKTFLLWPCAVSITIKSTPLSISDFALFKSSWLVPTAAPTNNFLFFTFLISKDCFLMLKFRWITPMPPSLPIAKAILLSVTVSIADDKKGTWSKILSVSFGPISVSEGKTDE